MRVLQTKPSLSRFAVALRKLTTMTMTADLGGPRGSSDYFIDLDFIDWGAIFAGAILASAVAILFLAFGSALGLSLTSAYPWRGLPATGLVIAGALWVLWVQVSCFFAGGYLAGRLRRRVDAAATPHEVEVRDGSHGLLVWALCLVVGALITGAALSGVISLGARVASGATSPAAEPAGYYVDACCGRLLQSPRPPGRTRSPRQAGHNRGRCSHRDDRRGASVDRPDLRDECGWYFRC